MLPRSHGVNSRLRKRQVWIAINVEDDLNPSNEKVKATLRMGDKIGAAVYRSGSDRWPYVGVEAG